MSQTLKIAIPMAGYGSRLRPHTWSKPKPLIQLAGKTVLDFVIEQFDTLPDPKNVEYIFIVGPQGDQIKAYMDQNHPDKTVHYVVQEQMRGQSDALYQAREYLTGPTLMTFSDTLLEVDLSFLKTEKADGVALVKPVPDPRRFGVAQIDAGGRVVRLIEKPTDMSNNLALVGFYYFRKGEDLIKAIEEQFDRELMLKGEYFLADAINVMIEHNAHFKVEEINTWLDAGTPEALFDTNCYKLQHGYANDASCKTDKGVAIIPPVFIHPSAEVESSVIGPNVSIGANCKISNVVIRNAIVDAETHLNDLVLKDSLLGRYVNIQGQASSMNVGDNTSWVMK
ncbi:MAG: nucleotidyltransferase [Anaerolineae bacterium]|nr:nucleotidyltransferase [Anaerolineae bacterium]